MDKYSIKYIYNYRFSDNIVKNKPFDFLLVNKNICIEYDGEQHYHVQFNKTLSELENQHRIDDIKTKYCKDKNIKLIRIPYWDFKNIEDILIKELNLK